MQCKHKISVTKRNVKKTENNKIEHYEEVDDRCSLKHCRTIVEEINEEWIKVIAEMKHNGSMIMHAIIAVVICEINFNHIHPFNEHVTKRIDDK